jgi:hypothetical protein
LIAAFYVFLMFSHCSPKLFCVLQDIQTEVVSVLSKFQQKLLVLPVGVFQGVFTHFWGIFWHCTKPQQICQKAEEQCGSWQGQGGKLEIISKQEENQALSPVQSK